jgi:hypothetical protein
MTLMRFVGPNGWNQCVRTWSAALARLSENLDPRNYDSPGLGPGLDVIGETRTIFTQEIRDDTGDEVLNKSVLARIVLDMFNFSLWQFSDDYW